MTLSQRIQTASADETMALLEEAVRVAKPELFATARTEQVIRDRCKWNRLISAGAHLDAAMMLLPEGCKWAVTSRNSACCTPQHITALDWVFATTPALALLSAICKARGL